MMLPPEIRWQPLREGDTLEFGGYRFEVLHIPGHTPGSIALLDREHGLLLPGDSIQKEGTIYMFGPRRNLERYLESLRELQPLEGEIRQILPSHGECPIEPAYLSRCWRTPSLCGTENSPESPIPPCPAGSAWESGPASWQNSAKKYRGPWGLRCFLSLGERISSG